MKKMTKIGIDCAVDQPALMTKNNQFLDAQMRLQSCLDESIERSLESMVEVDTLEWSFASTAEMEKYIEELRFFRS